MRFLPEAWHDVGRRDRPEGLRGLESKKLCVPWVSSGLFQQTRIEGSGWEFVGRETGNQNSKGGLRVSVPSQQGPRSGREDVDRPAEALRKELE